jgi:NitT/TauT family transport system ATP-binding protein
MSETGVAFRDVSVAYGRAPRGKSRAKDAAVVQAVADVDLTIAEGEFVALIGPSGCGKSTLLRTVADLLSPTTGTVRIDGKTPREVRLERKVGFVFQDAALLEWRTIVDNVMLPLELAGVPYADRLRRASALIEMVGIGGFEKSYPRQLSGGMRQRASIARAMSTDPKVLLMDEPFGALDQITRDRLNLELLELSQREKMTVVFVTHSIAEAVLLSDRVVIMSPRPGRIRTILPIDLPRPRTLAVRTEPRFTELAEIGLAELEHGFH